MVDTKIRVLAVDNDLEQCEDLAEFLQGRLGAVVDIATTGEEAIQSIREQNGNYDVVLMDQRLPDIDGITAMCQIKENFPVIPIILLTGVDPEIGIEALRKGAYRYLGKPPNYVEISFMVQHASELRRAAQFQEQLKLSRMLQEASRVLGRASDADTVLQETFRQAFQFVGDTTGLILSVEQDQNLRIVDCRGVRPEQCDTFNDNQIKADEGSFGLVVQTGEIFESEDTDEDLKEGRVLDFGLPIPDQVINIPIKRGEAVAAILVLDTVPTSLHVREALRALADIAGITLERVLERSALAALYKTAHELTLSQNLKEVLKAIVERTQTVLGADAVVLYEYDDTNERLIMPPKYAGLRDPETVNNIGEYHDQTAALRLIRDAKGFYFQADARKDENLNPKRPEGAPPTFVEREDIQSSGAITLNALGEIVGILFFNYRVRHEFFDEQERQKIQLFADLAAAAILNFRRLDREKELREQAETLREVSASTSSETDVGRIAEQILNSLRKSVDYTTASIQLIHGDRRKLLTSRGFDKSATSTWLLRPVSEDRLVSAMISNKKPVVLSDTSKSDLWDQSEETRAVKSWMGLPLVRDKDIIGILTLDHDVPGFYTEQVISLGMSFAQQAAIAIHDARLVERLRVLNEVGQDLQDLVELNIETDNGIKDIWGTLYDKVVEAVVKTLECTHCTFFALEDETLVPKATSVSEGTANITRQFKLGEGLVGTVAAEKQALLTRNATSHPTFLVGQSRPEVRRSMILAPVSVQGALFGVLSADQDRVDSFNDEDLRMLETLAAQLAAAIQNVKLLSQERRRSETLSALQMVTLEISKAVDLKDALRLITQNAVQLVGADTGVIHLIDPIRPKVDASYEYPLGAGQLPTRFPEQGSLTLRIYDSKEPIEIPDVPTDSRVSKGFANSGVKSAIGIPLLLDGVVLGVLFLNSSKSRTFSDEERHLLITLAEEAALVTDRLRRYEQRARDISALQEINKAILEDRLEDIPELVAMYAKTLTGADYTTVRLLDESRQFLDLKAGEGYETEQERLPLTEKSFSSWIATTGEAALGPNVEKCGHYAPWRPQVKSCMAAPLKREGVVVGTLYVESEHLGAFSQQYQLELLQALADQAALAMHIGELYDQRQKDLSALQKINEAVIVSQDMDKILDLVVEKAVETMPGEYGSLWRHDPATDDLVLKAIFGPASVTTAVKKGERIRPGTPSINRRVFTDGDHHICKDVESEEDFHKIYQQARSAVTVPLKYGDAPIGTLNVESATLNAFDSRHAGFLDTLADQAAIAITNAELFKETRDLNERLQQLQMVTAAMSAETATFERIVETIGNGLASIFPGGDYSLRQYIEDERKFGEQLLPGELAAQHHFSPPRPDGTTHYLLTQHRPLFIPAARISENQVELPDLQSVISETGVQSAAMFPLLVKGRLVGKLSLYFRETREFSDNDRQILQLFADQAAAALEGYRARRAQINAVSKISASISTDEERQAIFEGILDSTLTLMREASLGEIRLLEEDRLVAIASRGASIAEKHRSIPITQGITGWVARQGEAQNVGDVTEDERYLAYLSGTRSELAVPMKREGEVIGVLNIEHPQVNAFTEDDLKLAEAMAGLATVAITNAELYQGKTEALQRTQTLGDMSDGLADLEVEI